MNILVFGGTRLMGKHLVYALLAQGHRVTVATRGLTPDSFGERVTRLTVNRLNEAEIQQSLTGRQFDVIYDSLAYGSLDVKRLLSHLSHEKYVSISSAAVYDLQENTKEADFDARSTSLIWGERGDFSYRDAKQQAECAMFQAYPSLHCVAVRFPFVTGTDDYTNRLLFYVQHIKDGVPMHIDNFDAPMAFVRSDEAGKFLAGFAENNFYGAINGASAGTVSLREIADYVQRKTGHAAIVSPSGAHAPYNGTGAYSLNTEKAAALGFCFSPLNEWLFPLIDHYLSL